MFLEFKNIPESRCLPDPQRASNVVEIEDAGRHEFTKIHDAMEAGVNHGARIPSLA